MPELSICIPTYNRMDLLPTTLPTILGQTYGDFELVIVDNASTDGTEDYIRTIRDPRLRYVRNPTNVGLIGNQNRCIEEAKGSIIAIYHDHDLYDTDLVRQSMEVFKTHPNVGVVAAGALIVDPDDPSRVRRPQMGDWRPIMPGMEMFKELLRDYPCLLAAPTAMVRKACYDKVGLWRLDVGEGADRELWLRIFRHWDFGYLRGPLARLRDRPSRRDVFTHAHAKHMWQTLEGQAYIQKTHLEDAFRDSPVQLRIERMRAKGTMYREFWKWAIWSVAKQHTHVSEVGVDAFRSMGMHVSAGVLRRLRQSKLAHQSMYQALRLYRQLFV